MAKYYSPLRYPGGKSSLLKYLSAVISLNSPIETYIEAYAGGAGAALGLLFTNRVKKMVLNEYDDVLYKFWHVVLNNTEDLIKKISNVQISVQEWKKQKKILNNHKKGQKRSDLDIGFSTFFLNRCNRSGILMAGPIGGKEQLGKWKIDARFNKEDLIKRIERIAEYKSRIRLFNLDAIVFLKNQLPKLNSDLDKTLVYLDPPYYEKGSTLYRHSYDNDNHIELQKFLKNQPKIKWILSYDDVPFIHDLYKDTNKNKISMNHFAYKAKVGKELIITSDNCNLPEKQLILFRQREP